jgi:hypothetical protein
MFRRIVGKNSVVEYDPAAGKSSTLVTVAGATSCAFGGTDKDHNVIYIGGSAGIYEATVTL